MDPAILANFMKARWKEREYTFGIRLDIGTRDSTPTIYETEAGHITIANSTSSKGYGREDIFRLLILPRSE